MRHRTARVFVALALVPLLAPSRPAVAERVLAPGERTKEATDVVVGKVSDVWKRRVATDRYGKGTIEHLYLVEIQVEKVEKGDLKKGRVLYVRAWRLAKYPGDSPPVGPFGHKRIPKTGDRVRAFVVRGPYKATSQKDNGYTAVYPTGFDPIS